MNDVTAPSREALEAAIAGMEDRANAVRASVPRGDDSDSISAFILRTCAWARKVLDRHHWDNDANAPRPYCAGCDADEWPCDDVRDLCDVYLPDWRDAK